MVLLTLDFCRCCDNTTSDSDFLLRLLPPLDLLQHLPADILSVLCLELVLLNLAYVCIVDALPHDLQWFNILRLLLLLAELLNLLDNLISQLYKFLALLQFSICGFICKVAKLALLDTDQLVDLFSGGPKVPKISAFRLKSTIKTSSCEEFLTANKASQEFKAGTIADIKLLPHVKNVIKHTMVTESLVTENSFDLFE